MESWPWPDGLDPPGANVDPMEPWPWEDAPTSRDLGAPMSGNTPSSRKGTATRQRTRKPLELLDPEAWPWTEGESRSSSNPAADVQTSRASTAVAARGRKRPPAVAADLSFTPGSLDFCLQQGSLQQERGPLQARELAGADPAVVEHRRVKGLCRCSSFKAGCHQQVPLRSLQSVCKIFWNMPGLERGHMLRILHREAQRNIGKTLKDQELEDSDGEGSDPEGASKVAWRLCGVPVCFSNFCHLLGTSEPTVRKQLRGDADMRTCRQSSAAPLAAQSIDFFFYELYHSCAEPLPLDPNRNRKREGRPTLLAAVFFDEEPWLQVEDELHPEADLHADWNPDVPAVDSLHAFTLASTSKVLGLPRRFLPHCQLHDLYWLFQAAWDVQTSRRPELAGRSCPSYTAFKRRWREVWRRYLKIRDLTHFAQCQTCWELQKKMNAGGGDWQRRAQAAKDLRQHYSDQYLDRCIYWSCRFASQTDQNVLCIIVDSMDKTKLAWPRWEFDRIPKWLESIHRPRLVLTASLAHGWCTSLFVQHDNASHGANAFCEVVCRTIEMVAKLSQTSGRPMPQHLIIQADNTVAQAKNETAFLFLAVLVAKYKFLTTNIFFLMVGHTHEDVDQFFALVIKLVLQPHRFQTPDEFMALLRDALEERVQQKGEKLSVQLLRTIRDFEGWMRPLNVELFNCFATRGGVESPHSFSFKRRRDLTARDHSVQQDVQTSRPRYASAPNSDDVMCCVKTYMRDVKLMQAPVPVLPQGRVDRLVGSGPVGVTEAHPLSDMQIDHFLQLERACRGQLQSLQAADALHSLVHDRHYPLPDSVWLDRHSVPPPPAPEFDHPFFPHLPVSSWRLQVHVGR